MRRPLPPLMRLELHALGRRGAVADLLLLHDWRRRDVRSSSACITTPRTAHLTRAA